MPKDVQLQTFAQQLGDILVSKNHTLATAESCTGGMIAKIITDINGSSQWFEGSIVTYNNDAKINLLKVNESLLKQHGAVSQAVVEAMATGALQCFKSDFSVAVSGIAGPSGGSAQKPVGLVHIAWASAAGWRQSSQHIFTGNRDEIRRQTVAVALQGLLEYQH